MEERSSVEEKKPSEFAEGPLTEVLRHGPGNCVDHGIPTGVLCGKELETSAGLSLPRKDYCGRRIR